MAKRVVNDASMTATFTNECAHDIEIYWAETPDTAQEVQTKLAEIAAGCVLDFNTFVGHTFVARRGTRLLDTFPNDQGLATLHRRGLAKGPSSHERARKVSSSFSRKQARETWSPAGDRTLEIRTLCSAPRTPPPHARHPPPRPHGNMLAFHLIAPASEESSYVS